MMHRYLSVLILATLLAGCRSTPKTAPRQPWFDTETNLKVKADILETETWEHVDPAGILLYSAYLPWDSQRSIEGSYYLSDADIPAWQGYLMAAHALKESVTGTDQDVAIQTLVDGLLKFYEVTGEEGLLGRALYYGYTGPRRPWMPDKEQRPTRYWMKGNNGWWRNGLAKDHLNMSIFGAAIPLALDRQDAMILAPETKKKLIRFMLPAVYRLVSNDFQIIDHDGETTEFGNFSPQVVNGFNMLLVLHMMKSAASLDPNDLTPDQQVQRQYIYDMYEEKSVEWAPRIGLSFQALGETVKQVIGNKRGDWDKPSFSDIQAAGCAFFSLTLQEDRDEIMSNVRRGMDGLWKFVRYERNPMFAFPYVAYARSSSIGRISPIIQDLRDFPIDKWQTPGGKDTKYIQPLANRPIDSNYWKSSPFELYQGPFDVSEIDGPVGEYAGMDYLIAYWMGRYLRLVPEE